MAKGKFDKVLEKFPLGISVVTVGRGGAENGLTVSWAMPVAFNPLHLAIAVDVQHYSVEFLDSTKAFALNLLGKGQEKVAAHFAKQSFEGQDKLAGFPTREAASGAAVLTEALAFFDCEVVGKHIYGDHLLYVGRVVEAEVLNEGQPMLSIEGMRYSKK